MPKEKFRDVKFRKASLDLIQQANQILDDYEKQGYKLTLRQLYYQFVRRNWLVNKEQSYDRLGSVISEGRLAGLIDWDRLEDRLREANVPTHWSEPAELVGIMGKVFALDRWSNQDTRIEIWVEKDAVSGIFEPICRELNLPLLACRGYTSQSAMWAARERILDHYVTDQEVVILHFGDHDPSGIDMSRDIRDRLAMLCRRDIEVKRVALTMAQIEEYEPPPNPAKQTDVRFAGYQQQFGDESWELDALEPAVLVQLVRDHVNEYLDMDRWNERADEETKGKQLLQEVADRWDDVAEFLNHEE